MPNIFPVIADDVAVTSPATASYSARGSVDIVTFTSLFRASCLFGAIIAHPFGNHNGTPRKHQGFSQITFSYERGRLRRPQVVVQVLCVLRALARTQNTQNLYK